MKVFSTHWKVAELVRGTLFVKLIASLDTIATSKLLYETGWTNFGGKYQITF